MENTYAITCFTVYKAHVGMCLITLNIFIYLGLRQQRNDGGGCTTMREKSERVERPGAYVTE